MIRTILSYYAPILYVQIWEKRLKVTDVKTHSTFDDLPIVAIQTDKKGEKIIAAIGRSADKLSAANVQKVNPFSHPRVLFSDFYVAEKLLQHAFQNFRTFKYLKARPKVVIQPMEKTEGGLTMIEIRAFRELALGAGALNIVIHVGDTLSLANFDFKQLAERETNLAE